MSTIKWRRSPNPCRAHTILDKMFQDDKIAADASPATVYKLDPEFLKYNLNVFRTAFNELRQKHGVGLKKPLEAVDNGSSATSSGNSIVVYSKRPKITESEDETGDQFGVDSQISHHNQPVLMEVYRDPDTSNEMLIIFASLLGGVTVAEFSLVGSAPGTSTARITYSWPKIASNIEGVFAKKIAAGMPACHPKILALKNGLASTRNCIDETPQGYMELALPIPVQTNADTIFISEGKTEDGGRFLLVELTAYQTSYTVKKEDKTILFEDL